MPSRAVRGPSRDWSPSDRSKARYRKGNCDLELGARRCLFARDEFPRRERLPHDALVARVFALFDTLRSKTMRLNSSRAVSGSTLDWSSPYQQPLKSTVLLAAGGELPRLTRWPTLSFVGESGTLQDPGGTALAGRRSRVPAPIDLTDLHRPPGRMRLLEARNLADGLLLQALGVRFGFAVEVFKTSRISGNKAIPPFVDGLPADAILPAKLAEVPASERFHREFCFLVHFLSLFPWHPEPSPTRGLNQDRVRSQNLEGFL